MNNSNLTPKNIAIAVAAFCLLVAMTLFKASVQSRYARHRGPVVTFEKAGLVKPGMTEPQVQAIFVVRGWTSTPRPDGIYEMQWFNSDYTGVDVFFQNGHVLNATRIGALPQEDDGT